MHSNVQPRCSNQRIQKIVRRAREADIIKNRGRLVRSRAHGGVFFLPRDDTEVGGHCSWGGEPLHVITCCSWVAVSHAAQSQARHTQHPIRAGEGHNCWRSHHVQQQQQECNKLKAAQSMHLARCQAARLKECSG